MKSFGAWPRFERPLSLARSVFVTQNPTMVANLISRRRLCLTATLLALPTLAQAEAHAQIAEPGTGEPEAAEPDAPALDVVDSFLGHASFYASRLRGRRTASGEPYDPGELTAAHRSLPFGTWVRVFSLHSGQDVLVRINDRGPFVRGRVIDISRAAAHALGMVQAGTHRVRIDVLSKRSPTVLE